MPIRLFVFIISILNISLPPVSLGMLWGALWYHAGTILYP